MASKARKAFDANAQDIAQLLTIHTTIGGDGRGRRYDLEVLNKSAIVLITAFWEAYCEDIASEALMHIVRWVDDPDKLPTILKKQIATELKKDAHDLAIWKISGDSWRKHLLSKLDAMTEARNRAVNTPKSAQIDQLFLEALGIEQMTESWKWHTVSSVTARKKLDAFVTLRGSIAHRGAAEQTPTMAPPTSPGI